MESLTKPMTGLEFFVRRVLININWAKSWTWGRKNIDDSVSTHYIGVEKVETDQCVLVHCYIVPLKITIGWNK